MNSEGLVSEEQGRVGACSGCHVSVIVPCYNEEGVIEDNINAVAKYLKELNLPGLPAYEIIAIDDGSTDSTGVILDRMAAQSAFLRTIHHRRNHGRGRALQTGLLASVGLYVITIDADLSYAPDHIGKLLEPLQRGSADVVLASAYHPDGQVENVPFGRALLSRLGNALLTRAAGGNLRTVTCVVRGYTREVVDALILFSDGKDVHLEIIQKVRTLGFTILEVPARLAWRPAKRSRAGKGMSFGDLWRNSLRHLFFNFLLRPSSLFIIPIWVFTAAVAVLGMQIFIAFLQMLEKTSPEYDGLAWLYVALREHMLLAKISYITFGVLLVVLLQFVSLLMISKQSNHYYEEMLRYFSHLDRMIKRRQKAD